MSHRASHLALGTVATPQARRDSRSLRGVGARAAKGLRHAAPVEVGRLAELKGGDAVVAMRFVTSEMGGVRTGIRADWDRGKTGKL